jgi:hypothetical protein
MVKVVEELTKLDAQEHYRLTRNALRNRSGSIMLAHIIKHLMQVCG